MHLTAEQDRLRLLGMLGLKEPDLRPAPVPDAKSPQGDELRRSEGECLSEAAGSADVQQWAAGEDCDRLGLKRRREIREDFDREVLGRSPDSMPGVQWHVVSTVHEKYGGVDVITKRLAGRVGPWMNTPITI